MNSVLITGAAGFIGSHLCRRLLGDEWKVVGVDQLEGRPNESLKRDRLKQFESVDRFTLVEDDLSLPKSAESLFRNHSFDVVIHLAAQTGVRDSLKHTRKYVQDNLVGFSRMLEAASKRDISHFLYASSSSVYGVNTRQPYSVHQGVNHPLSLYAATKKSNEMLAHSFAHLTGMPVSGLRFFTVYGPWGRPDMAYYRFARLMMNDRPIEVYNDGDMYRDFTYIDDVVESVARLINYPPEPNRHWDAENPDPATSSAPYRLYNVGNNDPVQLAEFIRILERHMDLEARKTYKPMKPGEVYKTWSDCSDLYEVIGFKPETPLEKGIEAFVEWFRHYHGE